MIFGGEGFLGQNIKSVLEKDRDCFTTGVFKSVFSEDLFNPLLKNPYSEKVSKNFDVYLHLIDNKVGNEEFLIFEKKLAENFKLKKGCHLIIFSSSVIYANPSSDYAKRKIMLEKFWEDYCLKNGINLTILRLFNVYGYYQMPNCGGSLISNIFYNHLSGAETIINDKKAKRDFLFASDIGRVVKWVIDNKFYGKTDISSGRLTSLVEIIDLIEEKVLKTKLKINYLNNTENIICPIGNKFLCDKIGLTDMELGLKKTSEFQKNNHEKIKKCLESIV